MQKMSNNILRLFFNIFKCGLTCFYRPSLRRESSGEGRYRKRSEREQEKKTFYLVNQSQALHSWEAVISNFHSSPWFLTSVFMCALGEEGRLRLGLTLPCVLHNDHHLTLALCSALVSQPNPDLQRLNLPCCLTERTYC